MNCNERRVKEIFFSKYCFVAIIVTCFMFFIFSCSQSPVSGGVSVPNAINGYVVDSINQPVENAKVVARRIIIDQQGDQVLSYYEDQTDKDGYYSFSSIDFGRYVVTIEHDNKKTVIPFVDASNVDSVNLGQSILKNQVVVVKGRVVNADDYNLFVTIPGTSAKTTTNSEGFYVIDKVPVQKLRLAFVGQEAVNYLYVDIKPTSDTVFIEDVLYATNIEDARGYEPLYFTEIANSFSIIPIEYDTENLPLWYEHRDFSRVEYMLLKSALYNFTASSGMWDDPRSWDLMRVPIDGDTAVIENRTCVIMNDTIEAIVHIDNNADILLSNNVFFKKAYISNSVLRPTSDSIRVLVSGEITLSGENYLKSSRGSTIFYNSIKGTGVVNVSGTIQLDSLGASKFVGNWYVDTGKLRIRCASGTGTGIVTVAPRGNLDIEHSQALDYTTLLRLISDEQDFPVLELDNHIEVNALEIDGELKAAGEYTRDNLPDYLISFGSVTVTE